MQWRFKGNLYRTTTLFSNLLWIASPFLKLSKISRKASHISKLSSIWNKVRSQSLYKEQLPYSGNLKHIASPTHFHNFRNVTFKSLQVIHYDILKATSLEPLPLDNKQKFFMTTRNVCLRETGVRYLSVTCFFGGGQFFKLADPQHRPIIITLYKIQNLKEGWWGCYLSKCWISLKQSIRRQTISWTLQSRYTGSTTHYLCTNLTHFVASGPALSMSKQPQRKSRNESTGPRDP